MKCLIIILLMLAASTSVALGQQQNVVVCGEEVLSEFTDAGERQYYSINLQPGSSLNVIATPIGETLKTDLMVLDPVNNVIAEMNPNRLSQGDTSIVETPTIGSRGAITVIAANWELVNQGDLYMFNDSFGVGLYTIGFQCTLPTGEVVTPGALVTPTPQATATPEVQNFIGFPGLQPVSFREGVTVPLQPSTLNAGTISPGFEGIFGFAFTGNADDTVVLDVERVSGNLNLGIAVLAADNTVAFQASLVTSSTLSTTFTLPTGGDYTIGVFRVDLVPPAAPEATAFTVQATVNP